MAVVDLEKIVELYHNNKIAHAYLIETNNINKCYEDLLEIVKQIFCKEKYSLSCSKCNICNLVNQKFLPSLITIETESQTIKKEQILELKSRFSTRPIYTDENIYIIKEAEKLNASSANTMLKFVEEPDDNIIGFFITSNVNNVINTIKSRCEEIKVLYDVKELSLDNIDSEEYIEYFNIAIEYIKKLEVEKTKSIMYNKDSLLSKYTEREDIVKVFKIILIIYESIFNAIIVNTSLPDKLSKINFLFNNSPKIMLKKINILTSFLEDITSNVNLELLLDKFVIELGDINDEII